MWSKRRLEPYVAPECSCNITSKEMKCSEFRESSPVDQFMFQEIEVDGKQSVRLTSDIYMLFNQQRLDRLSRESLLSYFDSVQVREPQFSEIRSKLGDEQLMSFVKSRFIQSPSELMAWSQYLMSSSDDAVAALAAAQAQQTNEPTASVEPAPSE
ncbi:hypothetical protein AAAZ63_05945 [Bacteroides xylanisolvens]|uniref:hypothetical protein n=1 Tax=Bacteroides xylanisolvens TaxID=371601 RepID=UPI0032C14793